MIHALNRTGKPSEAVGYLAEKLEGPGPNRVLVITVTNNVIETRAFGDVTPADLTLMAAWLTNRAIAHVLGDG